MKLRRLINSVLFLLWVSIILVLQDVPVTSAQQPTSFELPVELVGFPIIIVAVRLSNFVKKLAYSLNPRTYATRSRRAIEGEDMIDMIEAEKRLVAELGENVCIYTRVCLHHAEKAQKSLGRNRYNLDWDNIFRHYKLSTEKNKEFYLLSVFLGDIVGSRRFCNQLAKRGRECKD